MAQTKSVRLTEKIAALREQMKDFQALEIQVHAAPDQQISLTDPDARAMATNGKGTGWWATTSRPPSTPSIT